MPNENSGAAMRGAERKLSRLIPAMKVAEGDASSLFQALPTSLLEAIDPFLLLQEIGPTDYQAGEAQGAPKLPHRGFEILTYVIEGDLEQSASRENSFVMNAGEASCLTIAGGLNFSEAPSQKFRDRGGLSHVIKLWLNLRSTSKRGQPRWQKISASALPSVEIAGVDSSARVVVGEFLGERSSLATEEPMTLLDFELAAGAEIFQPIPEGWNAFVYVLNGQGRFGANGDLVAARQLAVFNSTGHGVRIFNESLSPGLRFLFISGRPIEEPVVRSGAYVMNSDAEIQQAFIDFAAR